MNTKMIRYILAKMLGVEALLLLLPAFVSLLYRETEGIYFLIPAAVLTVIYLLAGRKKPKQAEIYGKEGMVVVASAWILWSMFGALPGHAVLAQLYPLGGRHGRAGICHGADVL